MSKGCQILDRREGYEFERSRERRQSLTFAGNIAGVEEASPRPRVRVLHTSDVHIDGTERTLLALRSVIDAALATEVDLMLIAGDLFDNARVKEQAISETVAELERLDMPVVVIPGNHDCMDERSIYRRADLTAAGEHVFFAGDPAGQQLLFEDLAVAIWARGIEVHEPSHRPLAGFVPLPSSCWRIVLTHGHYVPVGTLTDRSSQIARAEIGELDCDYLALGHWHQFEDVSEGSVKAFYSGSPTDGFHEMATANLVTFDSTTGVVVQRVGLERRASTQGAATSGC